MPAAAVTGMPGTTVAAIVGANRYVEPEGAVAEAIVGAVEVTAETVVLAGIPVAVTGMPGTTVAAMVDANT